MTGQVAPATAPVTNRNILFSGNHKVVKM